MGVKFCRPLNDLRTKKGAVSAVLIHTRFLSLISYQTGQGACARVRVRAHCYEPFEEVQKGAGKQSISAAVLLRKQQTWCQVFWGSSQNSSLLMSHGKFGVYLWAFFDKQGLQGLCIHPKNGWRPLLRLLWKNSNFWILTIKTGQNVVSWPETSINFSSRGHE